MTCQYKKSFLLIVIIFIVIVISYSCLLFAPVVARSSEATKYYTYGNEIVKHNFLIYHQFGLWDNQIGFGYPLIGHLSSQFYPITFISLLFSHPLFTIRIVVLLHLVLAGFACFYLLRVLKCHVLCSLLGSILYVVNYYVQGTVMGEVYVEIYNLVWMPLVLAFSWKALFEKKTYYAFFAGIALGMHILAMLLYATYFTLIIEVALYIYIFVFSVFITKQKVYPIVREIFIVGVISVLVAFGISAIKLLPVLQYTNYSMRSSLPLYGFGNAPNSVWELSTYNSLLFYVSHYIAPFPYFVTKYIPIDVNLIFLFLILLALFKKSKAVVFLFLLTLISLWASMGKNAFVDLYALFYQFFPGMKTFEHPYRFFVITNLTLPLLASFGLMRVQSFIKIISSKVTVSQVTILVITFLIIISTMKFTLGQQYHLYFPVFVHTINEGDHADVYATLKSLVHQQSHPVRVATKYQATYKGMVNYLAYINDIQLSDQYHPDFTLSYFNFNLFPTTFTPDFLRKKYTLLAVLNTKYLFVDKAHDDYPNKYISPIKKYADGTIYQINNILPFIHTPQYTLLFIGKNDFNDFNSFGAKIVMFDKNFDIKTTDVFSSSKSCLSDYDYNTLSPFTAIVDTTSCNNPKSNQLKKEFIASGGKYISLHLSVRSYADIRVRAKSVMTSVPAKFLSMSETKKFDSFLSDVYQEQRISIPSVSISAITPEKITFILKTHAPKTSVDIADSYFPGWNAYDNGRNIPIFMADGLRKGLVLLGAGNHTIVLTYSNLPYLVGVIISSGTVCLLLFIFIRDRAHMRFILFSNSKKV